MPASIYSQITILILLLATHTQPGLASEGPTDSTASERGLTAVDVKALLLAQEGNKYYKGVTEKNFKGSVLGYVTPWNSHGYDVATRWRAKFTHISPVWYQIKADEGGKGFKLTGGHDVDQGWIAKLREPIAQDEGCAGDDAAGQTCSAEGGAGGTSKLPPRVVPRVIVELGPQDLVKFLQQPADVIDMVVDEIKQKKLDGLVLEGWLQWSAMGLLRDQGGYSATLAMVTKLAGQLHDAGKVLLLAVPPVVPSQPGRPGAEVEHLQQLSKVVDAYSVMTYDYSASGAGPNAPLTWQEQNVQQLTAAGGSSGGAKVSPHQVLMGLNFYGYDFTKPDQPSSSGGKKQKKSSQEQPTSASPIMGQAFLTVLRKLKPKLKWEEEHAEHRIKYKDGGLRHTVYYPTPAALAARIQLAEQLGVGLSIWELGQGLDSFLDLL